MSETKYNSTRNYPSNHVSYDQIDAVTNNDDGTCSFKLDTIPEKGLRTIDVFQGKHRVFSISISDEGVCYQTLKDGLFTVWEDEI